PLSPPDPIAPTTIVVIVRTTASAGAVSISANIEGWPWLSSTDVLAVGWQFEVGHAAGFSGCAKSVTTTVSSSACGTDPFETSNSTWNMGLDGIQGVSATGPSAQLGWGSDVNTSAGSTPVLSGADRTAPGSAEVVLGTTAQGADSVDFALSYALALPPSVSNLVHGSLLPYVGGGLGAAALTAGALVYTRRRDRKLLETL
ncbi:MAG: hypothetical protein L3J96_02795, partial [Thermoplasmata archaeon]|nr:hypothetical protein [Thermoplasmata archaeon]